MKIMFLFVICLVLGACTLQDEKGLTSAQQWNSYGLPVDSTAQARRDLFVGRWYDRQNSRDGSKTMTLDDVKADGTYFQSSRNLEKNGQLTVYEEKGRWGVSGNIFFTIVTARTVKGGAILNADQNDAYLYDAYIVENATKEANTLKHVVTGEEWVSKRVGADFTFPSFSSSK